MEFQANLLGIPVDRPAEQESTALGAAFLCGIGLGMIDPERLDEYRRREKVFYPDLSRESVQHYSRMYSGWKDAIRRCVYDGTDL